MAAAVGGREPRGGDRGPGGGGWPGQVTPRWRVRRSRDPSAETQGTRNRAARRARIELDRIEQLVGRVGASGPGEGVGGRMKAAGKRWPGVPLGWARGPTRGGGGRGSRGVGWGEAGGRSRGGSGAGRWEERGRLEIAYGAGSVGWGVRRVSLLRGIGNDAGWATMAMLGESGSRSHATIMGGFLVICARLLSVEGAFVRRSSLITRSIPCVQQGSSRAALCVWLTSAAFFPSFSPVV